MKSEVVFINVPVEMFERSAFITVGAVAYGHDGSIARLNLYPPSVVDLQVDYTMSIMAREWAQENLVAP